MNHLNISFMEIGDVQEAAKVLSIAMLNNPVHLAVFQGNGEKERSHIEKMFIDLFTNWPGIVYIAREGEKIVGVMRMKSCVGPKQTDDSIEPSAYHLRYIRSPD